MDGRVDQTLDVLSGNAPLSIGLETADIVKLSAGVFIAMLLALLVAQHLK